MEDNNYYVYVHKVKNGDIFYVGQGKGYRYKQKEGRTASWLEVYNNNKCEVIIVKNNLTKNESLLLEAKLIKQYGRKDKNLGTLVNQNDGGQSSKGEDNYFYNKPLYKEDNGNYNNKYEKNPLSIPIYKLNLSGEIVKEYASATQAEEVDNYCRKCISSCCKKKRKLHKGFQFIYKKDYTLPLNHIHIPAKTAKKPIVALEVKDGKYIIYKYYNQLKEVELDGFSKGSVEKKLNYYNRFHKNYCFIYKDKLSIDLQVQLQEFLNTNKI